MTRACQVLTAPAIALREVLRSFTPETWVFGLLVDGSGLQRFRRGSAIRGSGPLSASQSKPREVTNTIYGMALLRWRQPSVGLSEPWAAAPEHRLSSCFETPTPKTNPPSGAELRLGFRVKQQRATSGGKGTSRYVKLFYFKRD